MKMRGNTRQALALLVAMSLPFAVGSQCAFIFSSGGSSDNNDEDKNDETIIVVKTGNFTEPATAGIHYVSGSLEGITGSDGGFQYEEGKTIRFMIGDIALGVPVAGKTTILPEDVAGGSPDNAVASVNIKRLLHSLDADPSDDVVTIPDTVSARAVRANNSVASAIDYLDFSDDDAFVNAASQLVAVLTGDYPHTAVLLDQDSVRSIELRSPRFSQD
ncbi:MAG: hypothetical protein R3E64_02580 [Halioglobus sp.]